MKTRIRLLSPLLASALAACNPSSDTASVPASAHAAPQEGAPPASRLGLWWDFFFNKPASTVPRGAIPVQPLRRADLEAAPDNSVWRLGHSTVLLKLQGRFWLTDPVFSPRSSPVQWAGPKRFHAPPITIDELPPIEAVVISHDHYDHLDHASVMALRSKTAHFIAPTGVGDLLVAWGIAADRVHQLAWWQGTTVSGVEWTAVPTQHFSGRGLTDANRRLWCAWAIRAGERRLFFGADSGYFDGFRTIGERLGPFDLTMLEAGAYDPRWSAIHMLPEQTVQAHQDLRGRWLMPIHNGTFDLAFHPWQQPFERVLKAAAAQGVQVTTPRMGERVGLDAIQPGEAWWRGVDAGAHPAAPHRFSRV
jgi:L-ascorbate metabolism protein UlaG (beta-lactamase superfamily)